MNQKIERFDWNSKALTFDNCRDDFGRDKLGSNLMGVLALPTVDYFLPVLQEVGFPNYLVQHPEIWKSVFAEFTLIYEQAMNDFNDWSLSIATKYRDRIIGVYESSLVNEQSRLYACLRVLDESHNLIEFDVQLKSWKYFLGMLANRVGKSVAIELEQWIYYHYLSDRFNNAVQAWWMVLNLSESLPNCLEPMLNLIGDLKNEGGRLIEFSSEIDRLTTLYYEASNFRIYSSEVDTYFSRDSPQYIADPYILQQAWMKNRVMSILQSFARSLNSEQIKTVVNWAENFSDGSTFSNDSTQLCGAELITTKILFSDFPSVI